MGQVEIEQAFGVSEPVRLPNEFVEMPTPIPIDAPDAEGEPTMAQLQQLKRESQARDHRIANTMDVSDGQMLLLKACVVARGEGEMVQGEPRVNEALRRPEPPGSWRQPPDLSPQLPLGRRHTYICMSRRSVLHAAVVGKIEKTGT
jgi:hypothetical protein